MTRKEHYFLQVGEPDKIRLEILNEIYNPPTQCFMMGAGLRKGMNVLDLGCGTGIMTAWIAEQVGSEGSVLGIDMSEEQLAIAKQNTGHLNNVSFKNMNAYDISNLPSQFDLIYTRFLLMHLQHPEKVITTFSKLLKPEGIVVCVGPWHTGHFAEPQFPEYVQFSEMIQQIFKENDKDGDFGKKLFNKIKQAGFVEVKFGVHQPILLTERQKSFLPLILYSAKQEFLDIGYAQSQLDTLTQVFLEKAKDPDTYFVFASAAMVSGKKAKG